MGAESLGLSSLQHKLADNCPLCRQGDLLAAPTALELAATPVPEPTTLLLWVVAGVGSCLSVRRRRRNADA